MYIYAISARKKRYRSVVNVHKRPTTSPYIFSTGKGVIIIRPPGVVTIPTVIIHLPEVTVTASLFVASRDSMILLLTANHVAEDSLMTTVFIQFEYTIYIWKYRKL